MRIREEFTIFWNSLSGWQMVKLGGVVLLFVMLMFSGWMDSCSSRREVRKLESEASKAKAEAEDSVKKADKLAAETAKLAAELKVQEEKLDVAEQNLKIAGARSADARAAYELVRGKRGADTPTADALCRELGELGYPCEQ